MPYLRQLLQAKTIEGGTFLCREGVQLLVYASIYGIYPCHEITIKVNSRPLSPRRKGSHYIDAVNASRSARRPFLLALRFRALAALLAYQGGILLFGDRRNPVRIGDLSAARAISRGGLH